MKNVHRVLAAYRNMDQRARGEVLRFAERQALDYPDRSGTLLRLLSLPDDIPQDAMSTVEERPAPARIHLVKGGK